MAVLVLLGLLATAGVKSFRDLKAARDLEADLEQRIAASQSRIRVLSDYVRMIEEDPLTLERLAREDLGMVKPGDVVIVLPESMAPGGTEAGGEDDASQRGAPPRFPAQRPGS